MKIIFLPQTKLGKWSTRFGAAFVALYIFSAILAGLSMQQSGDEIFMNPAVTPFLAISGFSALASGLVAFFTGVISIIKEKEKSVLVFLTTLFGLFVLFFLLGEFLIPH